MSEPNTSLPAAARASRLPPTMEEFESAWAEGRYLSVPFVGYGDRVAKYPGPYREVSETANGDTVTDGEKNK